MKKFILLLNAFICLSFLSNAQSKDTITTESGLKYVMLKPGNGQKPLKGQSARVIYTGKFMNGKQFESNKGYKPFKFKLGIMEVIPGWDEGILLMSKGEKAVFVIPSHLAYGKRGAKDPSDETKYQIPPDTDLIFEIELVSFK